MRGLLVSFGIMLLLATAAVTGAGQMLPSHTLLGTVSDPNRKPLPGVAVDLSNPASAGSVRTVTTDGNGRYRIEKVVPGTYVLTFRLPGFGSAIRDVEIGGGGPEFEYDVQLVPIPGGTAGTTDPQGPSRRVICGMTMITPPANVDPGILPRRRPELEQNQAKGTIRAVQPTMCWEPATIPAPPAQGNVPPPGQR